MAPRKKKAQCKVCLTHESRYSCPVCLVQYCSVSCFKTHKEKTCLTPPGPLSSEASQSEASRTTTVIPSEPPQNLQHDVEEAPLEDPKSLRPLTSLKWPYIPDESVHSDPLKRDDPKTLQLHHYESIATSPTIRKVLTTHPELKTLLTSINSLHGSRRQQALERSLGVADSDLSTTQEPSEEVLAFRKLAEAIEDAVRGGNEGVLGLDWDLGG